MKVTKRLMALALCLAMLLSGLALADDANGTIPEEGQTPPAEVQSAPADVDSQIGGGTNDEELTDDDPVEGDDIVEDDDVDSVDEPHEDPETVENDTLNDTLDDTISNDPEADKQANTEGEPEEPEGGNSEIDLCMVNEILLGGEPEAISNGEGDPDPADGPCTNGGEHIWKQDGTVSEKDESMDPRDMGAKGHQYFYITGTVLKCEVCGATTTNWGESRPDGAIVPHSYPEMDQPCACGRAPDQGECDHSNAESDPTYVNEHWVEDEYPNYTPYDASEHRVTMQKVGDLVCPDCGAVVKTNVPEGVTEEQTAPHEWTDASMTKCEKCGYENELGSDHVHVWQIERGFDSADEFAVDNHDGATHYISAVRYMQYYCEECGAQRDHVNYGEPVKTNLPHEFEYGGNGRCKYCDAPCQHRETDWEGAENKLVGVKQLDEYSHLLTYDVYAEIYCVDCGALVDSNRKVYTYSEEQEHELELRPDNTLACVTPGCGFVVPCKHPDIEKVTEEGADYDDDDVMCVDSKYHKLTRYDLTYSRCNACGYTWGYERVEGSGKKVTEDHIWNDDDMCEICYALNTCTEHEFEPVEGDDGWYGVVEGTATSLDAVTHQVTISYYRDVKCKKCGYQTVERDESRDEIVIEDHSWSQDGYCAVCGAKGFCKHPKKYIVKETGLSRRSDLKPIEQGEKMHTVYADRYIEYHCTRCNAWWGYQVVEHGIEKTEPHAWDSVSGSVCDVCGYKNPCKHDATEPYEETGLDPIESLTTATTHSMRPYSLKGTHCTNCDAVFDLEYTEDMNKIVTEPHKFVHKDGKTVCEVCGYIKPEEKAETTEKKTEESPFEEIADGTVVHGVTVGEPVRMGVTMVQAMAGIAAEYGADAKIEILNIDKVLTADECAALNALPPTERILVALSALGYGDEVKNAITELQLTLSEEARVLNLKVNTRVALMNDEAKAAHQKAIEKYFPNANGVAVTLEIRKAGETALRKERYGFVQSNGVWTFAKLEVAKA